jgi:CheY-like chemotaxis protein
MPAKLLHDQLRDIVDENEKALRDIQELVADLDASTSAHLASLKKVEGRGVLIVDDCLADAQMAKRIVQRLNPKYPGQIVSSGKELIAYLQGDEIYQDRAQYPYPALVLLDLNMPKMDGFAILTWLKGHRHHLQVPVVVLSGIDDLRKINQAYGLGARSYLTKPIALNDIKETLSSLNISV